MANYRQKRKYEEKGKESNTTAETKQCNYSQFKIKLTKNTGNYTQQQRIHQNTRCEYLNGNIGQSFPDPTQIQFKFSSNTRNKLHVPVTVHRE